ncbi:sensor histidine kinase [Deferribacter autotrophicus]|uniref:histidine kinase n=1 Tax=Deferribacter autotrophicus TaxID=500465 RepID=A0A5A8F2L8_9BACT|nr:sensor histidine kinase [Deferribacter autotrophicus]
MHILFSLLLEMSFFAVIAYVYSKTPAFKPLITKKQSLSDKLFIYLFFSTITILGTYLGVPIKDAIANTRAIGAIMAGLLGGPLLGGLVGFTGGLHRYFIGGFTAFSCGVSTTTEGIIGGLMNYYLTKKGRSDLIFSYKVAFAVTFVGETIQMIIILLLSKPFSEALDLVKIIAIPMIFANSFGSALFISILKDQKNMLDEYGSIFSKKALNVAEKTLNILSKGFNKETVSNLAKVILEETGVGAVAITDKKRVLTFEGLGSDHHLPGEYISSKRTIEAIEQKKVIFIDGVKLKYKCSIKENCPLGSVLIVPLILENEVIGTIKLYEPKSRTFLNINKSFGEGIGNLLSTQLLISKYEEQKNLLVKSELKLLQAQINPHFLFNALNTIISVVRTKPECAKDLLIHLSNYFRKNLKRNSDLSLLADEIEHVKSYLFIEEARFSDRLKVFWNIDESLMDLKIPTFTLQPIVENAIKHGISKMVNRGILSISAYKDDSKCIIEIKDNAGAYNLFKNKNGLGMKIVDKRIKNLCGSEYGVFVECIDGEMTKVKIVLPEKGCL